MTEKHYILRWWFEGGGDPDRVPLYRHAAGLMDVSLEEAVTIAVAMQIAHPELRKLEVWHNPPGAIGPDLADLA